MKEKLTILFGLFLVLRISTLFAYPGESIVRDDNDDYIITYWNGSNLMQSKFYPATKIKPRVNSSFKISAKDLITYRYAIFNGASAKQPISSLRIRNISKIFGSQPMVPISSITTPQAAISAVESMSAPLVKPRKWDGAIDTDSTNTQALQADWFFFAEVHPNKTQIGVMPGSSTRGFGFSSLDLPGIGNMLLEGEVSSHGVYEDEGPDPEESEIVTQLDQIEQNNFVSRNAAIPTIAVPVPFDAAVLLDRIRAHVATWPDKQLLDSAFAAQLDRTMDAAAGAYRNNQPKAGREHIESLRRLLDREHKYLDHDDEDGEDTEEHKQATRRSIDRLAARVLDFDLRYVLKRMGREHEHKGDDKKKEHERK